MATTARHGSMAAYLSELARGSVAATVTVVDSAMAVALVMVAALATVAAATVLLAEALPVLAVVMQAVVSAEVQSVEASTVALPAGASMVAVVVASTAVVVADIAKTFANAERENGCLRAAVLFSPGFIDLQARMKHNLVAVRVGKDQVREYAA